MGGDANMEKVFLTGANGVVGSGLCRYLQIDRTSFPRLELSSGSIDPSIFRSFESVVHCAGLSGGKHTQEVFDRVNCEGSVKLAEAAKTAGVNRFVFMSSAKVFGEFTHPGECFSDGQPLAPTSRYAKSKVRAEEELSRLSEPARFEVVILRPSAVISPEAKRGALALFARLARRGCFVPIPSQENRRDLLSIENLAGAVAAVLGSRKTLREPMLVADGFPLSTKALVGCFAAAGQRKPRTIAIPSRGSRSLSRLAGKESTWHRLFGDFAIDASLLQSATGWRPVVSTRDFIAREFRVPERGDTS